MEYYNINAVFAQYYRIYTLIDNAGFCVLPRDAGGVGYR
jgi:hypothetical protein